MQLYMNLPLEIQSIIYMYALPSIFHDYPTLYDEMKEALSRRNTYAHRVYRCKQIAKLYMRTHEKQKIEKIIKLKNQKSKFKR